MIVLFDCNNFYASCQRMFRADLANVPIVVLSNNDGCVIARSAEAKALGIPMGAPFYKCKQVIEQAGGHVFSANFALYGDMSDRVMSIISDAGLPTEIYSIDEAFVDLRRLPESSHADFCRDLKHRIEKYTGIPISVGLGPTKTLAKLANSVAKKKPESAGCWRMMGNERGRMMSIPVSDVWGVGNRLSSRLEAIGIQSTWDLRNADTALIRKTGSVNLERTVRELRGDRCLDIDTRTNVPRQQIIVSRSFGHAVSTFDEVNAAIATFAEIASSKMCKQNSVTTSVRVVVAFDADGSRYHQSATKMFMEPTASFTHISRATRELLGGLFVPGRLYRRGGVILGEVIPQGSAQQSLFIDGVEPVKAAVDDVVSRINGKIGRGAVKQASAIAGGEWQMRQNYLSPRYTTRWKDLPKVM